MVNVYVIARGLETSATSIKFELDIVSVSDHN